MQTDAEFGMVLEAPDAYNAQQKGLVRALAAGVPPDRAAAMYGLSPEEMAGALGVFRKARRLAHRAHGLAKKTAATAVRLHPLALATRGARFVGRGVAAATGPIRRRIFRSFFGKLIDRRARLLSWRRRRSLHPTASDRADARAWAVRYVKGRGLLGKLVGGALSGDIGDPRCRRRIKGNNVDLMAFAQQTTA